jgi:hypothetical protein
LQILWHVGATEDVERPEVVVCDIATGTRNAKKIAANFNIKPSP